MNWRFRIPRLQSVLNTKYEKHQTIGCSGKYLMKARAGIETPLMPAF
jgi:hypothetical protein